MAWDLKKTIAYVKSKRPIIAPNYGFIKHLEKYEKALRSGETKQSDAKEADPKLEKSKAEVPRPASNFSRTK